MMTPERLDELGNDPGWWVVTAHDLLVSYDILCNRREAAEQRFEAEVSRPKFAPRESRACWVELMLLAFGIENLFKALWLAKGNKLYENGNLIKISKLRNHELPDLADLADFEISPKEQEYLVMLSKICKGIGRYPVGSKVRDESIQIGWSNVGDKVMNELVTRLNDLVKSCY